MVFSVARSAARLAAALVLLATAATATTTAAQCGGVSDAEKVDCGYTGIDQAGCESKGCCWSPAGTNSATPWCFSPSLSTGYSLTEMTSTSTGYTGKLTLLGGGTSTYGPDLQRLTLSVYYASTSTFRLKITDATSTRWEVPQSVLARPSPDSYPKQLLASALTYEFHFTSSPFTFKVTRKSDGAVLFSMDKPFVFKDQYIELSTSSAAAPSVQTFGVGESTRLEHALQPGSVHTLWAADVPAAAFYRNLYGSFPYYMQLSASSGAAHGALLLNSNGMDVVVPSSASPALTFRAVGGIIDLYVFSGPTPDDVTTQYTAVVGKPAMMPYWSLGFHNCKYGYSSVQEVEDVVSKYRSANIPLETQWMDIDYMQDYRDFTFSSSNFPLAEVQKFVGQLHANGQHFVPIVDPGIMVYPGYSAYEEGVAQDLFLKDVTRKGYYLGQVWPGPTYFPDFLHPKAQSYWTEQIRSFHAAVPVDGLWIDMNEISNFCNDGGGQVCTAKPGCPTGDINTQTVCCLECTTVDADNKLDFPPYRIQNKQGNGNLGFHTVAMSSYAYGNVSTYDAHNLYGLTEQIATNAALASVRGSRPFLLSRSSFPSTGKHSAKWTGDNAATWQDLQSSIISVMDMNLFGVPMVGADICGFLGDTTEELCARWIAVGAFYPFSRDHSALNTKPQELYLWPSVTQAAQAALSLRYQLLPYLYTLFYKANQLGTTVARPLWYNYPTDTTAQTVFAQFMLGPSVLVSPVVQQGATAVKAYFPRGLWYDLSARKLAIDSSKSGSGVWQTLDTPLTASANVHISGGSIVPLQQAELTVAASRASPFTLLVALCDMGEAQGQLYFDDGEQIELNAAFWAQFNVVTSGDGLASGTLSTTIKSDSYAAAKSSTVQTITVMGRGLKAAPASASLNGHALAASQITFDQAAGSYSFVNLAVPLNTPITLDWKQ